MFTIRSSRTSRRAGRRPAARRGIAVLMFAVTLMLLMMFVAIAADFSRLYVARNALQTAADAGALAGAVELMKVKSAAAGDTAKLYAAKNKLFGDVIPQAAVTIQPGVWTDASAFTPSDWNIADAVRVIVARPVAFQFARLFGINERLAIDTAIGWSGANVEGSKDCIKPWSIPLHVLRDSITAYAKSKDASYVPPADTFNLSADEGKYLNEMFKNDAQQLNFTMHQGAGKPDYNSGNFQSVAMPAACKLLDGQNYDCSGKPQQGNAVIEAIKTCSDEKVGIGDVLMTQTGVQTQPTINAIEEFCTVYMGAESCTGVRVKATFWTPLTAQTQSAIVAAGYNQSPAKDGGNMPIEIRTMGSFIMQNVYKDPKDGKAAISGKFVKEEDAGTVGPNPSLLQRVMLVR